MRRISITQTPGCVCRNGHAFSPSIAWLSTRSGVPAKSTHPYSRSMEPLFPTTRSRARACSGVDRWSGREFAACRTTLGVFAEFEREMIRERVGAFGRPRVDQQRHGAQDCGRSSIGSRLTHVKETVTEATEVTKLSFHDLLSLLSPLSHAISSCLPRWFGVPSSDI
jgi:hypothetical protein